jgi:hypothetical protein
MTDLESATTAELIAELKDRFDHIVIAGIVVMAKNEKDNHRTGIMNRVLFWDGCCHTCAGLAQQVGIMALDNDTLEDEEGE